MIDPPSPMNRRHFLTTVLAATGSGVIASAANAAQETTRPKVASRATTLPAIPDDLAWHDVRDWGLEGRAFDDTASYFDRLPKRAKDVVRPEVWGLSHHTAGMSARFRGKTDAIYVRYEVTNSALAMPHMPATGVSGVDLYATLDGKWHWLATHSPREAKIAARLIGSLDGGSREYQLNFPLYNGVKSMEIGVPKGATFEPISPRKEKPILFYGTSITQGGCASRSGMAFVEILGRRLNRPMLNFGFSGNGRTEIEVAQFLAEVDASIFVLDCIANMGLLPVTERTEAVVKLLREKRPDMPILLLEPRLLCAAPFIAENRETHAKKCAELRRAYDNLTSAGVKHLHYRKGDDVIGSDGEGTVDGSHPTDLGMVRYADALEPDLRKILETT
jgi:lysophospholipase L1-like esterase